MRTKHLGILQMVMERLKQKKHYAESINKMLHNFPLGLDNHGWALQMHYDKQATVFRRAIRELAIYMDETVLNNECLESPDWNPVDEII